MSVIKYISYFLLIILVFSCDKNEISTNQADSFVKLFGTSSSNIGLDIVQSTDGGYFIVGSTMTIEEETDMFLTKTDNYGNQQWIKSFGDTLNDVGTSLQLLSDNNLIVLGSYSNDATGSDVFLVKMNQEGDTLWTKSMTTSGSQIGKCIQETSDGGFIIVGRSIISGDQQILTLKTNENGELGDEGWYVLNGYSNNDEANVIIEKNNNTGYAIIGNTSLAQSGMGSTNILVVSVTSNGVGWSNKLFGSDGIDIGEDIINIADNDYIISGTLGKGEGSQVFVHRVQLDGENISEVWDTNLDLQIDGDAEGKALCKVDWNSFVLLGKTQEASTSQLFLTKIDGDGNIVWTRYYGEFEGQENAYNIGCTSDGGFIIIGSSEFDGNAMVSVIKTDSEGNI